MLYCGLGVGIGIECGNGIGDWDQRLRTGIRDRGLRLLFSYNDNWIRVRDLVMVIGVWDQEWIGDLELYVEIEIHD